MESKSNLNNDSNEIRLTKDIIDDIVYLKIQDYDTTREYKKVTIDELKLKYADKINEKHDYKQINNSIKIKYKEYYEIKNLLNSCQLTFSSMITIAYLYYFRRRYSFKNFFFFTSSLMITNLCLFSYVKSEYKSKFHEFIHSEISKLK